MVVSGLNFYILTYFDQLTMSVFALQRIRELEDRIDLQKRQIKEIEEKVYIQISSRFFLRRLVEEV